MDTAAVGGAAQALALEAMEAVDARALAVGDAAEAELVPPAGASTAKAAGKTTKSAKTSSAKKSTSGAKSPGGTAKASTPKPVSTTKVQASGAAAVTPAASGYAAAGAAAAMRSGSLEDKLFEFMKGYVEKMEKELDDRITQYKAAIAKEKEKSGGGGLFGKIVDSIGGTLGKALESVVTLSGGLLGVGADLVSKLGVGSILKEVEKIAGKAAADALFKSVGAPLLAAIGTAIGGPALGMLVAQLGPKVIEQLVKEVRAGGSSSARGSSGSSEANGSDTASEQLQMMEIERLVQKLQRMYSTISNVMKSLHDMKMSAIGNIR